MRKPAGIATLFATALVLISCGSKDPPFGHYDGKVTATWVEGRNMVLTEDFTYVDGSGTRWDAPRGSTIDGASIPRAFWTVIGGPFEGSYRYASVIHDVYCVRGEQHLPGARPWQKVHRMFYDAMRCSGVPDSKALVMYGAVYKFGPTWDLPPTWWERTFIELKRLFGPLGYQITGPKNPDILLGPDPHLTHATEQDYKSIEQLVEQQHITTPEELEQALKQ
ncbi:MAG: DUF1353 domain-containing protein [Bryobacteraceae bacterium]